MIMASSALVCENEIYYARELDIGLMASPSVILEIYFYYARGPVSPHATGGPITHRHLAQLSLALASRSLGYFLRSAYSPFPILC